MASGAVNHPECHECVPADNFGPALAVSELHPQPGAEVFANCVASAHNRLEFIAGRERSAPIGRRPLRTGIDVARAHIATEESYRSPQR